MFDHTNFKHVLECIWMSNTEHMRCSVIKIQNKAKIIKVPLTLIQEFHLFQVYVVKQSFFEKNQVLLPFPLFTEPVKLNV